MGARHLPTAQSGGATIPQSNNEQMQEVLNAVERELEQLLQQRAQITKRIGTVKQTILGLVKLFGNDRMSESAKQLVYSRRGVRSPGLTDTCRMVLIEADQPLNAREICARIEQQIYPTLARHKDPLASVTTVLNRLLRYGEVSAVAGSQGGRAFLWACEKQGFIVPRPGQSAILIRPPAVDLADDLLRRCAK